MPSILCVCTANICRSPMAEAILKRLLSERSDADQWLVDSAGTWANDGHAPAYLSEYVMAQMGMDISSHQSQSISLRLLANFDLILTMEEEQKKWLITQYKDFTDRTFMISEMIGETADIKDPIGGELTDYQDTAFLLEKILTDGLDRIVNLAFYQADM
jgi:protein-tyrosine-phosphatase